MKYYGQKSSVYGRAYRGEWINRNRQYYDALVRSGRKRARQSGQEEIRQAIEEEEEQTMWIVTLHFNDGYGKSQYQEICACETEASAHRAGNRAAAYYNGDLPIDLAAGVIDCHWELPRDHYTYSVKEHKGEWI